MYVKYLMLKDYRNYSELNIELVNGINVFIGDNAQGKTNILESIYYCGFAKSHRTSRDKELISWNKEKAFISIYVSKNRIDKKIQINILKNGKKAINVNSIKINKISELVGTFNVVIFSPEDLKIVKDSPAIRRKFMDMEICQLNPKYYYYLVRYNKILDQRNFLLKKRQPYQEIISVYDEQLAMYGEYIVKQRVKYIDKLNMYGKKIHDEITSGKESILFKYMSNIKYLSDINLSLKENLAKYYDRDLERGNTSVGPHRDDLSIYLNDIEVKTFGSQGQQRTSILTMKFASLEIIKEITGEYPVLLLDDVLSELDMSRKSYILKSIDNMQTIITCTGIDDIEEVLHGNYKVFNVIQGDIR